MTRIDRGGWLTRGSPVPTTHSVDAGIVEWVSDRLFAGPQTNRQLVFLVCSLVSASEPRCSAVGQCSVDRWFDSVFGVGRREDTTGQMKGKNVLPCYKMYELYTTLERFQYCTRNFYPKHSFIG